MTDDERISEDVERIDIGDVKGDLIIEAGAQVGEIHINQTEDVNAEDSDLTVKNSEDVIAEGSGDVNAEDVQGDVVDKSDDGLL